MEYVMRLIVVMFLAVLLSVVVTPTPVLAKSLDAAADQSDQRRYIVVLQDPPLATYDGRALKTPERDAEFTSLPATANSFTGARKLDVRTFRSQKYLRFLDERLEHVRGSAALELGREINITHRYRNAINGFAAELGVDEVRALRNVVGVKEVRPDRNYHLLTDSGPKWLGAADIHNGDTGFAASGGEGTVVGIIDSGINWNHSSFQDPGEGAPFGSNDWDHENPYPTQLGLCSDPEVLCNDKLVGVYDYVKDLSSTEVAEENTKGLDNSGHGSHVASTVAGNPQTTMFNGQLFRIAGVAPNANIISYRVCFVGDPDDPDDDKCQGSAILSALEQAITDQVDVVNLSLGSSAYDPWTPNEDMLTLLNLRDAGIFAAAAAGNGGPNPSTIDSPASAPWVSAVGAATHDRIFGNLISQMSGGDTTPPGDLPGASITESIGVTRIVYAKDYGNALCGEGEPELASTCGASTGATNPFLPGTFNGEIVVCDRGEYGRVEKGKNLQLAGAGGFILANTDESGESINSDSHCLPAIHIGDIAGDELRSWLASGSNHQGSITDYRVAHSDLYADQIASFSARGPNLPPVEDILKPDVIAPGSSILAAWTPGGSTFVMTGGTSMSSPHIAGAAALIESVHPDWTPSMISSALAMTATTELAVDFNNSEANPHKRGSGRPRLGQAVNAALYLDEDKDDFIAADPQRGGDPKTLNLPGMVDNYCRNTCSFSRTVTDLVGGASWSSTPSGFPNGVEVSVSPQNFTLANGASRNLSIDIDLRNSGLLGKWVYGEIVLSSAGHPDAVFTVAIFADGGELPEQWTIDSEDISGWQEFTLSGLTAMPDATITSGGLVVPTETLANLPQDPDNDSPYDDSAGLLAISINVPPDTLLFHTETLESTAVDLDLFVGLDANNNGIAEEEEEICTSHTPSDLELCDLYTPVAGNYWVIVQNWKATNSVDDVNLITAVVAKNTPSLLAATGNGIVEAGASHTVRLSWDNVNAAPGTELIGAVGLGTHRDKPNNVGIIPVTFTKTAVAEPKTLALMSGVSRGLTLEGGGMHNQAFIDIPPGADSLTVAVSGGSAGQSDNLEIELYKMDFEDAFTEVPFAAVANMAGGPVASATGSNGNGPVVTISGSTLSPGRWYTVIKNNSTFYSQVSIRADVTTVGDSLFLRAGIWKPADRPGISQGYDVATVGKNQAFLWYTYDEDGNPDWYLAAGPNPQGNIWVAELFRYTNDGSQQHESSVGHVSITTLAEDNSIFSFVLYGENGSERMIPISRHICPTIEDAELSYTGMWSRRPVGIGGSSALVNGTSQAFIHFLYDDHGNPRWLLSAPHPQSPTVTELSMRQFTGFCTVCDEIEMQPEEIVGVFTREFSDETHVTWTMDYLLNPPLSGSVTSMDEATKFTDRLECK